MSDIPVEEHSTEGDGEEHGGVPPGLMLIHEIGEWQAAIEAEASPDA